MWSLIALMAAKKTVVDPTLATFESRNALENGGLWPSYAPFVGTMPSLTERGFRQGGFETPPGVSRPDCRASFAKMLALCKALHDAGVPIVAGTDGFGTEIVRELGGWRPITAHRRDAQDAVGDVSRPFDECRRAAAGGRLQRATEVALSSV